MVNPFEKELGIIEKKWNEIENDLHDGLSIAEMFERIWAYHDKLGHDASEDKVQIIRDGCLALYQEVAELTDSFPWKPWRKLRDQKYDINNACREIVDIIFFLAKIMRAAGISTNNFIEKFDWVLNNNLARLENGYSLVKGGDNCAKND